MHSGVLKGKLPKNAIGSVSPSIAHRNHLQIDVFMRQNMPKRLLNARFLPRVEQMPKFLSAFALAISILVP
jgi:hypothetical protein